MFGSADQEVLAAPPEQHVAAMAADQLVVAVPALERVVAAAAADDVVALAADEDVVTAGAHDHVAAPGAPHGSVLAAGGGTKGHRLAVAAVDLAGVAADRGAGAVAPAASVRATAHDRVPGAGLLRRRPPRCVR